MWIKDVGLVILSSVLLVLSFPKFDLGFLAWVGLTPLFIPINRKNIMHGFILSLICGILFFLGIFNWILHVQKYTLLHHALLALYLGSYFGFFGLVFNFISKRWAITPALFAAPFLWVSWEYIRSNLSFLSFPWGLLGHSQYKYPVIIQIASITGTYGISFLIVLVNAALAGLVYHLITKLQGVGATLVAPESGRLKPPLPLAGYETLKQPMKRVQGMVQGDRERVFEQPNKTRGIKFLVAIAASLLFSTLLYGYFTITNTIAGNKIKISLVQGNIEQGIKWDVRYARYIMQTYADLTQEVTKDQPVLIVWPEAATPGSISLNPRLYIELKEIVIKSGAYLLLGSAQHQKLEGKGVQKSKIKYSNSAFLIRPDPAIMKDQRYDKIRLFPFGEYLPYKDIIPWSIINVREYGDFTPGKQFTVFELPTFRFGTTVCWENVFPDLVRQFVKGGAQCIINITNEARFGKTAASHQLAAISVFRAVENRIFVVRCANTGVSCIIDPYGRIVDRIKDEKGQDIFVRGVMSGWIIPFDSKTIYTRYGDLLVWIAIGGSVVFLAIATLKSGKR